MAESATSVGSLTFFGLFAMFSLSPLLRVPREALRSRKPQPSHTAIERLQRDHRPHLACPLHPQTSYWLGDANEMLAINTILIIVNGGPPVIAPTADRGSFLPKKAANLRLGFQKVFLTPSWFACGGAGAPIFRPGG